MVVIPIYKDVDECGCAYPGQITLSNLRASYNKLVRYKWLIRGYSKKFTGEKLHISNHQYQLKEFELYNWNTCQIEWSFYLFSVKLKRNIIQNKIK